MLNEIIRIEISAEAVAWYGAIVVTGSLLLGIYKVWSDLPRLKITVAKDQEIWGENIAGQFVNLEPSKTFWLFNISNISKHQIIIAQIGAEWRNKKGGAVISHDYSGNVNKFELNPGDSKAFTISETLLPISKIKNVWVKDAAGKTHIKVIC